MSPTPQLTVGGRWLSAITPWGDLEWSTVWPGGSESLQFGVTRRDPRLFRPDAPVRLWWAGECLWSGLLLDPTPGGSLVAEGLYRKAEDYPALTATYDASADVNDAVVQAIARGLPWIHGASDLAPELGVNAAPALALDQVHTIRAFLDAAAQERGLNWGVLPSGDVVMADWLSVAAHIRPGVVNLGISRDGYADQVFARYMDSSTSTWETVGHHDTTAHARWGHVETTIANPLGQGEPMTSTRAQALLDGIMAQGKPRIGWTSPIEVEYGDLTTATGQPVEPLSITARRQVRAQGLLDDVADLSGQTWVDIRLARVRHTGGRTTLEPQGLSTPMRDALQGVK